MSNFRDAHIVEQRVYDNPRQPATSPYDVALPITVTEAVFDADTGESLNEILANMATGGANVRTYGVSIDTTNSNPYTSVSYTDNAIGMVGGNSMWDNMPIFRDIRPCLFNNGAVVGYLNPNNFAQWADGQGLAGVPDITSGNAGDVMIEIPRVGWRITQSGSMLTVQITNDPNGAAEGFRYLAHTRVVEGDRNFLYVGAYKGFMLSNRLRSLSGRSPSVSATIAAFRTAAQANGTGYDQQMFFSVMLLQILYLIRFKNLNSQAALGNGRTNATGVALTGSTNTRGMNWGTQANTTDSVKCLGVEDLWGNVFDWVDGCFITPTFDLLTAFQGFNDGGTGANYTSRGNLGVTATLSVWIRNVQGTSERGFLAAPGTGGSETTFFSDWGSLFASRVGLFGGHWNNGSVAGVFYFTWAVASNAGASVGGRLMFL